MTMGAAFGRTVCGINVVAARAVGLVPARQGAPPQLTTPRTPTFDFPSTFWTQFQCFHTPAVHSGTST
jgi:hypothetical protein